jgi:hypothetical protein
VSDVATLKAARIITSGRWARSGQLDLSGLGLRNLPDELFSVGGLRVLDLSRNRLADLPTGLFDLADLEQLDLGGNRLAMLPPAIGRLTVLRVLDMSENRLTQLPRPIAECQSLTTVGLYGNSLTDVTELSPLVQLDDLDLSRNQLSCAPSLSPQGRLSRLDLRGNKISELPVGFSRLRTLSWLDLSGNRLTDVGPLLGLALTELYLDDNLLASFPDRLAALPTLRRFSASGNPFADSGSSSDLAERARAAVALHVTSTEQDDRQYFTGAELNLGFDLVVKSVPAVRAGIDLYYKQFTDVSATVDLPDGSRIQMQNLSRKGALEILRDQREVAGSASGGRFHFDPGYDGQVKAATEFLTQLAVRAGELELVPDGPEKPITVFRAGDIIIGAPGGQGEPSPGLLGGDGGEGGTGATETPSPELGAAQAGQRFFLAELEGHPKEQPLRQGDQYTIAFSVGPSFNAAIGQTRFPDELLAAADKDVEVFDLTVQLDSNDFEIFSDSTQRLRVPRAGRSLGKARFDISPRHDGDCLLAASVHYKGNFLHQMKLTILVGDQRPAEVDVSARGRPPDSAATLKPRDISILLEPAPAGGFLCTALGSVAGRAVLPITATELAAAVDSARDAMMDVIRSVSAGELVFQSRIDIPPSAQDAALRTLARAGERLFQQLFLHPAAGADARRVGDWLRGYAMNPGLRLNVQIFAYQAPLPWAMLYLGDASAGAKLDWNNFLGMRHVLEQLPLQMSLDTVDNEIPSTPRLSLSVNVNTTIDQSMKITLVAAHQQRWRDTAAARPGLSLQSRTTKSEVVHALADGHTGDQVVYFYCHATASGQASGNPDDAAIIMGENDAATVADLNIDAPTTVQLPGNPLVFINACESAELSPLFYNGFVPYFMAKGARGVIGTECKTPALFAIEWADAFFDRFLDGTPVGETVLELRRDFVGDHGNPLGLIYAVHCDADTRIAPALARAMER